jgi:hypothetical protein
VSGLAQRDPANPFRRLLADGWDTEHKFVFWAFINGIGFPAGSRSVLLASQQTRARSGDAGKQTSASNRIKTFSLLFDRINNFEKSQASVF